MKNRWCTTTPSLQVQMLHLFDLRHQRNTFELGKIPDRNATVHDSRNPTICDRKVPMQWRAFVRKNALVPVLLYKPTPTAGERITKGRYIPPAHDPSQSGRQVRLDAGTPGQLA